MMALVKPKKKPVVSAWGGRAPNSIQSGAARAPRASSPVAPTQARGVPTQPNQPAAPQLAAVPKIATAPPPPTLQSTADRNQAAYDYGTGIGDINSQLRELAANYGGAPSVTQYGYDPATRGDSQSELAVQANAPGSTLEVLARNLGLQHQSIDENANAGNTFFSSRRLADLGNADKQYSGDVAQAQRDYQSAINRLTTALLGMRGTRNQNFTNADIADQQAALAAPPEPQATAASPQPGYLDAGGHFVSQIYSPDLTAKINQWIDQSKKPRKR